MPNQYQPYIPFDTIPVMEEAVQTDTGIQVIKPVITPIVTHPAVQDLATKFLGGLTPTDFTIHYVWGLIGFFFNIVLELYDKKNVIKEGGGFSISYFIKDNVFRFICSLIALGIAIVTMHGLFQVDLTIYSALMTGFGADRLVKIFRNKAKDFSSK